jgi:hypothetical protein
LQGTKNEGFTSEFEKMAFKQAKYIYESQNKLKNQSKDKTAKKSNKAENANIDLNESFNSIYSKESEGNQEIKKNEVSLDLSNLKEDIAELWDNTGKLEASFCSLLLKKSTGANICTSNVVSSKMCDAKSSSFNPSRSIQPKFLGDISSKEKI